MSERRGRTRRTSDLAHPETVDERLMALLSWIGKQNGSALHYIKPAQARAILTALSESGPRQIEDRSHLLVIEDGMDDDEEEAVAWQYRLLDNGKPLADWHDSKHGPSETDADRKDIEFRPLYTTPRPASEVERVEGVAFLDGDMFCSCANARGSYTFVADCGHDDGPGEDGQRRAVLSFTEPELEESE